MTRAVIVALAAAALAPCAASAQYGSVQDGPLWGERVRVTPFAGVAPRLTRTENLRIVVDGLPITGEREVDLAAGPAGGAEVEVRVWDRFSVLASGLFIARGESVEMDPATGNFVARAGTDVVVGKLGVAMRLREPVSDLQMYRVSATVFAAPAFVRELAASDANGNRDAMNMLAANFGANAELPIYRGRLALQVGLEDFLVFWNEGELARRTDASFARQGWTTQSTVDAGVSHMPLLRAGVTVRF